MTLLGIMFLIAAGLFLLCILLITLMIASHVYRKRAKWSVGWSVDEALNGLEKRNIKPWEVDT